MYASWGRRLAAIAAMMLVSPVAVQAQEKSAPPAQDEFSGLLEIVVTARRVSESLQTIPVAVTALSGDFLEQQNIKDVTSIPQFTPNLTILQQSTSPTAASVYIRGIGNQEPSSVAEQAVGIYLDGVYVARSAGALFDLVDLERIEVLRGPQGTLFGRNTVGGAIQLVSRKPSDNFHAEAKAGYGRYNDWYLRSRVDTGIIADTPFKASFSAMHRQRDGYVDNRLRPASDDPGALNGDAFIANIQADFEKATVNYSFDYNDRRGSSPYFQVLQATPDTIAYFGQSASLGGDPFLISPDRLGTGLMAGFRDRDGKTRYDATAKIKGHGLTVEYEALPEMTLKSISSYRTFFQDTILTLGGNGNLRGRVIDFTSPTLTSVQPVTLLNGNNAPQKQWQFSQELQALGTVGEFSYVAGAYYFYEKSSESNQQALTVALPVAALGFAGFPQSVADAVAALNPGLRLVGLNLTPVQAFGGTASSKAAFGQVSWKPALFEERLELTGGLRYTEDRKTLDLRGDVVPNLHGKVSYDDLSWLLSANYRFTDDVMGYVRLSTGYRSGGMSPRAVVINAFEPEDVMAYEGGLKTELFDRRVRFNLALFQTDYDNQQINQFAAGSGGVNSLIVNAGKVQLRGVEAELTVAPTEGLTFDGSLGYTDPKYKQYLYRDPLTNVLIDVADEARMPQSAKFNAHVGGQYSTPVELGRLTARVDYAYRSTLYYNNLDRVNVFNKQVRSRPDHNLKARLSLSEIQVQGGEMEIGIWGDNLTNQRNIDFAIDFGSLNYAAGSYKQPRTFGVDAKISF